jgi:hypothetical protein
VTYAKSGLFWSQCFLPSLVMRRHRRARANRAWASCGKADKDVFLDFCLARILLAASATCLTTVCSLGLV